MFKLNWEKSNVIFPINNEVISQILNSIYKKDQISNYGIINDGCSNINLKIYFSRSQVPRILRIYPKNSKAAYIEQKVGEKLKNVIEVPEVYHIGEASGYIFAIEQFLSGTTLRDLLQFSSKKDIEKIMFKVGRVLYDISKIKFDKSGFFNQELKVSEYFTKDSYKNFCQNALKNENVKKVLSSEQCSQINALVDLCEILLSDENDFNLVHGDFDPANILVNTNSSEVEISGIIDWEFAFSGSSLTDVANMLRYSHYMPEFYEQAFLQGLSSKGYILSENWRAKTNMYNLLALLDCIVRSDVSRQPNRIKDIKSLVSYILSKMKQFYKKNIIQICEYNLNWPKCFEFESNKIKSAFKTNLVSIHHVGSTSIPNLAAKSTIDILVEVKDIDFNHECLLDLNYTYQGGFNIPFRKCFTYRDDNIKVNLHVFEQNDPEVELNILFRDYLRNNGNFRVQYQELKYKLVSENKTSYNQSSIYKRYTLGKNDLIQKILQKTGFDRIRFLICTHYNEWKKIKEFRNKYFFNDLKILDPYTWTFDYDNHKHFVLYKGIEIIGYSHVQLWPKNRAALRIIVIDEPFRGELYGEKFVHLIEKWLRYQGYYSIHIESSQEALGFYKKLRYIPMKFNDPFQHDVDPKDIPVGKML